MIERLKAQWFFLICRFHFSSLLLYWENWRMRESFWLLLSCLNGIFWVQPCLRPVTPIPCSSCCSHGKAQVWPKALLLCRWCFPARSPMQCFLFPGVAQLSQDQLWPSDWLLTRSVLFSKYLLCPLLSRIFCITQNFPSSFLLLFCFFSSSSSGSPADNPRVYFCLCVISKIVHIFPLL